MPTHIVVDYGHGGSKPGAVYGGVEEKTVNLLTGNALYQALHTHKPVDDLRVLLIRDGDYDVPLLSRCQMINQCADTYGVDLAISVHYNAAGATGAKGFEVFYHPQSVEGRKIAGAILGAVRDGGFSLHGSGIKSTADLGRDLAFIHKTKIPAVLVEVGFLTNPQDLADASSGAARERMADRIAAGIWDYLKAKGA